MAFCPLGFQVVWQVMYPDDTGVDYWRDYNENVSKGLEDARADGEILRFVWAWPNGSTSKYEADPKRLLVVNVGTEHARVLRRVLVHVQSSPSADAEMVNTDDMDEPLQEVPADCGNCTVVWQVAYGQYWWDYDKNVSHGLEHSWKSGEMLAFNWDWKERKQGEISEYVADPLTGYVVNQSTLHGRKIRRMLFPVCVA